MLAELARLLQDPDFDFAQPTVTFVVLPHEPGQLDRPCKTGGPSAHEHHVHRYRVGVRGVSENQPIGGQRRLKLSWSNRSNGLEFFGHLRSVDGGPGSACRIGRKVADWRSDSNFATIRETLHLPSISPTHG